MSWGDRPSGREPAPVRTRLHEVPASRFHRDVRRQAFVVVLVVTLATAGAMPLARHVVARRRTESLLRMFPTLDPTLARHVSNDSDREWTAYARSCGVRPLMDAVIATYRVAARWPYAQFMRDRARYESITLRVATVMESLYDEPASARSIRRWVTLPPEQDFELHQLNRAYTAALTDSLPADERLSRLDGTRTRMLALGARDQAMAVQFSAAMIEVDRGRSDRFRARIESALSDARALEDHYLTCQILGVLAEAHRNVGHPDSMQLCLDEGIRLARRHRFPDQAARLMLFDASHASAEGRLALAADRLTEGAALLESFGGGSARVRLVIEYAGFLADLGYWDLAQRTLRRLPPLIREFPQRTEADELVKYAFDADCVRARVAFARGDTASGARLLGGWLRALPSWLQRIGTAKALQEWSWGLQRAGAWREALDLCQRGIVHCDGYGMSDDAILLALRRTALLERLSRLDAAKQSAADVAARLQRHQPAPTGVLRALRVARARIAFAEGRRAVGRQLLQQAFETPASGGGSGNPSRQEDMEGLSPCDAGHELAGLTPREGYAFELRCRVAATHRWGRAPDLFAPMVVRRDGIHLVYHVLPRVVLRWTASARGVVRDTVPIGSAACAADVREAVWRLQSDRTPPPAWFSAPLERLLERLARALLPDSAARAGRIEITPDGDLAALPFEALPVMVAGRMAPLALAADVAYVHPGLASGVAAPGHPLIVSDPALPADLGRRYGWTARDTGSDAEARTAERRWPGAMVLRADAATKPAFMRLAPEAPWVYIDSHHVMDPSTPFIGFIPLAAPEGAPREASLLESTDVRALDLSGCRLAVLASCASGASARPPGASPSLGDAFLDAGAASVISSFWDVGDAETRVFMRELMTERGLEADPVRALGAARRRAMRADARAAPRVWAAWSVAVSRPPG